ncbi:MAG: LSU ribosomal protein L2p (L8e), partial [uncultured Thermomicrobiales bacterium]
AHSQVQANVPGAPLDECQHVRGNHQ